ncbi:NeuD/PglB/VioB family sugar acetyltransferase [Pseudomonas fluorescens]|uniref:2,3,4,5-tetrahydropyridine-2,6-dicarboxylate N-acetyltransferase n=1 Tax=Pseudomonas fluorescens TaxID=294 RepID=A0A5E6UDJ0_PSEFL|nr:NeuD/PglB/VioB family sugar acetyltransferase [Pseudomonas fluorescens]VVN03111.1 2,3,4,5-tetrahydropyridine-2,6-dicarboxylate N-acetyltransferase [Pseudomonas fluorescens]
MTKSVCESGSGLPSVLLWGGKSKARIVEEMLKESDAGEVGIIFDNTLEAPAFETSAMFINDVAILKANLSRVTHYVVCISGAHGYARVKTAEYLERLGLIPITLIHERSFVEPTSSVGVGCQIMPGAVVHKFSKIGIHTFINTNATIDHECNIGDGVHVMGNAAITGMIEIGDYATIGTNATVLPFVKIGIGAFVGAGAVVTKDVEPYAVVAGVPAKTLRKNELQFYEDILLELVR